MKNANYMKNGHQKMLARAGDALSDAEYLLIGAGAGLSASAGLSYSGTRFKEHFSDFIRKYGIEDMYSAAFYPFRTQEETWAYWARHIAVNRWAPPALPLYRDLLRLVDGKDYFVITTNVDAQFEKTGFPPERLFPVQGDYGFFQCAKGCHEALYGNQKTVYEMLDHTIDLKIPANLVPRCPVCGGDMAVHIRKDEYFVENELWRTMHGQYTDFVTKVLTKKAVLLELGVGYNTPGIIRFPFEQITCQNAGATLVRVNMDYPDGTSENARRTISFADDIASLLSALLKYQEGKSYGTGKTS